MALWKRSKELRDGVDDINTIIFLFFTAISGGGVLAAIEKYFEPLRDLWEVLGHTIPLSCATFVFAISLFRKWFQTFGSYAGFAASLLIAMCGIASIFGDPSWRFGIGSVAHYAYGTPSESLSQAPGQQPEAYERKGDPTEFFMNQTGQHNSSFRTQRFTSFHPNASWPFVFVLSFLDGLLNLYQPKLFLSSVIANFALAWRFRLKPPENTVTPPI